ncbi:CHASE domain-containing protein [Quatrionicoccus australiensis]|uniref:CHASE domain-containing protein n=1 Tax=Quatrionicoccus australiensis TaxID=138118 RepID=UPI001CFA6E1F|nr:CHASE domain-containing protein [Quatrionicoccus australiensis]MCB4360383.1 CHASE domain-containing protein [Quatrionicoccus australiensis]
MSRHQITATSDRRNAARWLWSLLVFVLLAGATLAAWRWQSDIVNAAREESNIRESAAQTAEIRNHLRLQGQFLRSLQAFATANGGQDSAAWQRFTKEIDIARNLTGLFAFAYAPAVYPAERAKFLAAKAAGGHRDFQIYPPAGDELALPVTFIAPDNQDLRSAIGFNLLSENIRREAIEQAIASHDIILSGPITLIIDQKAQRTSFQLIQAVYRPGMPLNNVAERRLAFSGVVLCAYHVDEFIASLSHNRHSQFGLKIYDDGGNYRPDPPVPPQLMFTSQTASEAETSEQILHHEIDFGGRNWILHYGQARIQEAAGGFDTAKLILYGGLLASLSLAFLVFHQASQRQRAERYARRITADLRHSEERLRLANAGSNDGLWDQNLQTGEDYMSPRMAEIFGFPATAMPDSVAAYIERIHPVDAGKRRLALRRHFREQTAFDVELRIIKPHNAEGWVRIRGEAVRDSTGKPIRIAGSVSDITERKDFEAALLAANLLMQSVLDAATEVAIISCQPDGLITVFNKGAEKMLGYSATEMLGQQTPLIIHDPQEVASRATELSEELGEPVAGFDAFVAVARLHESEQREWSYIRKDGRRLSVVLVVTTQRNISGEICGYLGIAVDISDRKEALRELQLHRDHLQERVAERTIRLNEALRQAQGANIAKSEFLANMSHELRTPMHAILSFSELGKDRADASNHEKLAQYFSRIGQSAQRLLALINELLDLSKLEAGRTKLDHKATELLALVKHACAQLDSLLQTRKLTLAIDCTTLQSEVICDPLRIEQVIHNLMANAIKFSPSGGHIAIQLFASQLPDGQPDENGKIQPALGIRFIDQGLGIPPDELESIFGKFVQSRLTKTGAGGTGLGLAICREIVVLHRGTIVAGNSAGGGACFTVTLPLNPWTD